MAFILLLDVFMIALFVYLYTQFVKLTTIGHHQPTPVRAIMSSHIDGYDICSSPSTSQAPISSPCRQITGHAQKSDIPASPITLNLIGSRSKITSSQVLQPCLVGLCRAYLIMPFPKSLHITCVYTELWVRSVGTCTSFS